MLRQYGPAVPEDTLRRLVKAFSELRAQGSFKYGGTAFKTNMFSTCLIRSISSKKLRHLGNILQPFPQINFQADDGLIQYPYSTREVVNIVKHLERFPDEGLGAVVRDVAYSHM